MDVKVEIKKLFDGDSKVKAAVDLVLDDCFVVKNVKLVDGSKGLFLSMPNSKDKCGRYHDTCFPINQAIRAVLTNEAISEYQSALGG